MQAHVPSHTVITKHRTANSCAQVDDPVFICGPAQFAPRCRVSLAGIAVDADRRAQRVPPSPARRGVRPFPYMKLKLWKHCTCGRFDLLGMHDA